MSNREKFYITTPIYYANGAPHIGHAYTTIAADICARYKRLQGYDVHFLTGMDEHGQKVADKAQEKGVSPQEFVDDIAGIYQETWAKLDIDYTYFYRTTDSSHIEFVQNIIKKVYEAGYIYKDMYKGLYCIGCEAFISQKDLTENGLCPDHQSKPQEIEEENYFFKLTAFKDKLLELYNNNPNWMHSNSRMNEMKNIIENHLQDFSISRPNIDWGIEFPIDKGQKVYVWFDALFNYAGYAIDKGIWPADIHFLGKDIAKFHTIYWPAMLLAAEYDLPKSFLINGYLTVADQKMSKSIGNVIDPLQVIEKYHRDALVFYMFNEVHFGGDGNVSIEQLEERYKTELSNKYGNLLNRMLMLANKNEINELKGELNQEEKDILDGVTQMYLQEMSHYHYKEALIEAWRILHHANKYVDETEPWKVLKLDKEKGVHILNSVAEMLRVFALLTIPFFPHTSKIVLESLGLDYVDRLDNGEWENIFKEKTGFKLKEKSVILYKQIESV